jgi:PTH1 family peptidyl-tRNA hydrolase
MYLIVGLGNPGREYADTRHNVGFMVIDRLCIRLDARLTRYQFKSLTGEATYKGQKLLLVKPQTYMNLSGQAVSSLVRFYKLPLERLLVIHDDLDLPPGSLRLRPGGGSAGQKGVQSIIDQLGSSQFPACALGLVALQVNRMRPATCYNLFNATNGRSSPRPFCALSRPSSRSSPKAWIRP